MSVNNYSFDDITIPQPPVQVDTQLIDYVDNKLPQFLNTQYLALLDLVSSIQNAFLINDEQILDVGADKITNNTQFVNNVFVGAESKIALNGVANQITIDDAQGTPVTRVILGKLSSTSDDYGIKIIDASGAVKFQSGSTTVMDGGIITANTVTATQIAADTITATQIAAGTITATELAADSVTAAKIDVANLAAVSADLGTVTAGTLTGTTIQTASSNPRVKLDTSGIYAYKADGTNTAFIGNDGQFRFGTASGDRVEWNNTTLSVTGDIISTGNIEDGAVTSPVVTVGTFNTEVAQTEFTVSINRTTRGGNVIIIAEITGNPDDNGTPSMSYTNKLEILSGSTVLASGSMPSAAAPGDSTINCSGLDGSPNGSISSSATTTYTLKLTVGDAYDSSATPPGGFGNPASYKLITLETLK
jgi:hypothetical protein